VTIVMIKKLYIDLCYGPLSDGMNCMLLPLGGPRPHSRAPAAASLASTPPALAAGTVVGTASRTRSARSGSSPPRIDLPAATARALHHRVVKHALAGRQWY